MYQQLSDVQYQTDLFMKKGTMGSMKLTFSLAMGFWSTLLLKESAADKKSLASEDVVFIMVQNWDTFAFLWLEIWFQL